MGLRAALYLRVSTTDQGTERQEHQIRCSIAYNLPKRLPLATDAEGPIMRTLALIVPG
jgi:DNA invertase Pin-like site-specific DNA recombinase